MSGLRELLDTVAEMRPGLEARIDPATMLGMRRNFDQLAAEAAEAGMDPRLFGAMACAALAHTGLSEFEAAAVVSLCVLKP